MNILDPLLLVPRLSPSIRPSCRWIKSGVAKNHQDQFAS
ncbi:hypothetical protein EV13_1945 [Prochlorococcus sp. MIT 0702]|nr:hypothetical protein EV13_1945 [Prochlorococcus sp. MIT 0702]KGG28106.1 hypothetical protein EV12_0854 [Prochlorococcus sp. MIT 0701]KGG32815.1 hypothetical protein EV14_1957 [Prochlorococcus sp. MIT 0703]